MQINEQVLLTAGFIFILTNLVQWIFGPIPRDPIYTTLSVWPFPILDLTYPIFRITIIVIGIIIYIVFWWLEDYTRMGAIVRAGMDDKEMTMGLGINLGLVTAVVFFFGTSITGIAGVIGIQLLGADLELSLSILKFALVVVVVGGVGSVHGALLGSMLIAFIDTFGKALFPEFAMFTIFLAMIIILLLDPWPSGKKRNLGMRTSRLKSAETLERATNPLCSLRLGRYNSYYIAFFCLHFTQSLMGKAFSFAIFAMSLDLLVGYTGLFSLGHAAFFGAGSYTVAMLMLHAGISSFWISAPYRHHRRNLSCCCSWSYSRSVHWAILFIAYLCIGRIAF